MKAEAKPETMLPTRRRFATPALAARQLALATANLSARRQRDSLPGRIETRRLVLRPPIRGDVPDLVKLADNRNIAAMLSRLPSPYTRADGIGFVEIIAQRPDERPYAITLDDRLVGVIGLSFGEGHPPEFGYWVGEPYWGQGIVSEAARALLDAAHRTGKFPLIRARALKVNAASRRVLEKSGFQPTGESREIFGNLGPQPLVHFELEQPRWM